MDHDLFDATVSGAEPTRTQTIRQRVRAFFAGLPQKRRAAWEWIRFGDITEHVTDSIEGIACEVEYRGRAGKVVGFWAYGYFCHDYPYRGNGRKYGGGYDERPFQ
jgi:hypothetical protein